MAYLYVDENFSYRMVEQLRVLGHDGICKAIVVCDAFRLGANAIRAGCLNTVRVCD
jgi:hypothetical protein